MTIADFYLVVGVEHGSLSDEFSPWLVKTPRGTVRATVQGCQMAPMQPTHSRSMKRATSPIPCTRIGAWVYPPWHNEMQWVVPGRTGETSCSCEEPSGRVALRLRPRPFRPYCFTRNTRKKTCFFVALYCAISRHCGEWQPPKKKPDE